MPLAQEKEKIGLQPEIVKEANLAEKGTVPEEVKNIVEVPQHPVELSESKQSEEAQERIKIDREALENTELPGLKLSLIEQLKIRNKWDNDPNIDLIISLIAGKIAEKDVRDGKLISEIENMSGEIEEAVGGVSTIGWVGTKLLQQVKNDLKTHTRR